MLYDLDFDVLPFHVLEVNPGRFMECFVWLLSSHLSDALEDVFGEVEGFILLIICADKRTHSGGVPQYLHFHCAQASEWLARNLATDSRLARYQGIT